jgi:hypothetical protein
MGCSYENSRGDCTWKRGLPYPCALEEMSEEERERAEYFMERDYDMEDDDE